MDGFRKISSSTEKLSTVATGSLNTTTYLMTHTIMLRKKFNRPTTKLTMADLSNATIHIINESEGPPFEYIGYYRVKSAAAFYG
jgi:hypothetical protein